MSSNLPELIASSVADDLILAAGDPRLTEDLALTLLERRDLPPRALEMLARNNSVLKHRKVLTAIASHPRTPRWVALPVLKRMFTFELMHVAQAPAVAPHVKIAADEVIVSRLESISAGERMTLAKQGSRRLAAALLADAEPRIVEMALDNPRITEGDLVKLLLQDDTPPHLFEAAAKHSKWRLRSEVQLAILKHPECPITAALQIAEAVPPTLLKRILRNARLAEHVEKCLEMRLLREEKA